MTTKWYHYLLAFLAGGIFINVLPHFINGISGQPFPSPFSDPPGIGLSSPVENVIWATINFLVATAIVLFGKLRHRHPSIAVGYFLGGLAMALFLANYFAGIMLG